MNSSETQSFWSRPVVTWTATALLGALFVLAFLTYLATDLVSNKLLDSQLYTGALEENFFYNRVYTDLLADPALEEATTQLLGNFNLESLGPSVYSLAVSTLYLVVPPDTIQTATEGVIVEKTPYSVSSPEEFNCQPNRGGEDKPLFLLNHWIERVSPSRVDAVWVNDHQFLLDRARECAEERGQIPNFVAVNFYLIGDVVDVVDELNGVRDSDQP